MRSFVFAAVPLLALAACGTQSTMPPTTTAGPTPSLSGSPASKAPESINSLPNGAQVNAPLAPAVGDINSTRVGPSVPVRRPTTTGY